MARGQLAFVENGDDGDDFIDLSIEYGVMLNAEASKTRLQMIYGKSDLLMPSQDFEAFCETAHVDGGLSRTELAARVSPDV
jgi:hypothetical protein